jgi:phospholipid/cholesterol/gamma-HCH transport system substrate-binding protein
VRAIRRVALVIAGFLLIGVAVGLLINARQGASGYEVRAVFDNASFVISGEDVKVAGVKVGAIAAVDLTAANKAAVVLRIDDAKFTPFRRDAHCEIGLQSLIGEQFVQCTPTQPRPAGASIADPLPTITSGAGQGQHLLPVQNTTTPVGVDLLDDITRLPEQERLRLIITELGAGLAGNGQELHDALLRASPALQQTDRVIGVLAGQDRLLAQLTDESDRVLAPLAAQRAHLGGFIVHTGQVAFAAAARGDAIAASLAKFPPFLHQLVPAANRLGNLAGQMTPALQSLQAQVPAINTTLTDFGPLVTSSTPAIVSLGRLADRGRQTFPRIDALARQLDALGIPLAPLASNLAALSQSFDNAGGIEDLMRFIYYYTGTVNGEDALGHYIRSSFEVGACSARVPTPAPGCPSTFDKSGNTATGAATTASAANARQAGPRRAGPRRAANGHGPATAPPSAAPLPPGAQPPPPSTQTTAALLDYLMSSGGGR